MQIARTAREVERLIAGPAAMLKFSATWCGPCKAVAPAIERLCSQYPKIRALEIDIDAQSDIAATYKVTAVPTFIFFCKGREVDRVMGANVSQVTAIMRRLANHVPSLSSAGPGHRVGTSGNQGIFAGTKLPNFSQWPQILLLWIKIYVISLFSFDARAAVSNTIKRST